MQSLTISSTTRTYPKLPYEKIKNEILGPDYQLSLVFVGAKRAQQLNQTHRQKNYVPNVLSFPLDAANGEIYICPLVAARESSKFNLSPRGYIGYLFIHGLLHLQGHQHSTQMDQLERSYIHTFGLK